jgi:hypothetical protein
MGVGMAKGKNIAYKNNVSVLYCLLKHLAFFPCELGVYHGKK